jgi:hypothetical protein
MSSQGGQRFDSKDSIFLEDILSRARGAIVMYDTVSPDVLYVPYEYVHYYYRYVRTL